MSNPSTWVVTPCPRSRIHELHRLVDSLKVDPDRVVVVTTQPDPIQESDVSDFASVVVEMPTAEINIAKWWNAGLDYVEANATTPTQNVLVVSSDATGDENSLELLSQHLRGSGLAMVGPDWHNLTQPGQVLRQDLNDVRTLYTRVPGACYMIANELGLRVDVRFRWWYSDDDFEMQARSLLGIGLVGGTNLKLGYDSPLDEQKSIYATEDRALFTKKWGVEPW